MGQLPKERLKPGECFQYIALDYLGPISVWENGEECKSYVMLANCLVSRAVHLELVLSADTESFVDAIRRYVGRRGKFSLCILDNQASFVKGAEYFKELNTYVDWKRVIESEKMPKGMNFQFAPPRAPHFNGVSERLVRVVKNCLKRTLNNKDKLDSWSLYTVLAEIEGIINSRPLCAMTSKTGEMTTISPAMLLVGRNLSALPEPTHRGFSKTDAGRLFRKRLAMTHEFWKVWYRSYLQTIGNFQKWQKSGMLPKVDDVVLLYERNSKRNQWKIGRITELQYGVDNIARVARVKTAKGEFIRSVRHLYRLEEAESNHDVLAGEEDGPHSVHRSDPDPRDSRKLAADIPEGRVVRRARAGPRGDTHRHGTDEGSVPRRGRQGNAERDNRIGSVREVPQQVRTIERVCQENGSGNTTTDQSPRYSLRPRRT
jgi:hypothetical protein